ncbi:MAG: abortive infection system antitoxin AbiGi family protein [Candidatus Edwardsbacteria bacterium]|nr:abortive infection system antitoxin AbiGi family protein [Candidatus Edwardsbacteria bacterium]
MKMSKNDSSVSANSLFHFTKSMDNLIGILKNSFCPHYCIEDYTIMFGNRKEKYRLKIPMVCFCDLPLFNINKHIKTYGSYGIGLSKEWGVKNGVSPVLYIRKDTKINNIIKTTLNILNKQKNCGNHGEAIKAQNSEQGLLSFIKPYEGKLKREDKIKRVRFYDEREWRYVPKVENDLPWAIAAETYNSGSVDDLYNGALSQKHKLDFEPEDIKYLIINDETEILPLIRKIEMIKGHFGSDAVNILTTRIITIKQIREDYGVDI